MPQTIVLICPYSHPLLQVEGKPEQIVYDEEAGLVYKKLLATAEAKAKKLS